MPPASNSPPFATRLPPGTFRRMHRALDVPTIRRRFPGLLRRAADRAAVFFDGPREPGAAQRRRCDEPRDTRHAASTGGVCVLTIV